MLSAANSYSAPMSFMTYFLPSPVAFFPVPVDFSLSPGFFFAAVYCLFVSLFPQLLTTCRMHPDLALKMMSRLFSTGLLTCLPVLGLTMAVGLLVSVVQVVTQVQEMSLTFIPKLVVAAITLVVFGPWMLRQLTRFSIQLWSGIPSLF
jgi:flagellar biosynthetic protein FliQ